MNLLLAEDQKKIHHAYAKLRAAYNTRVIDAIQELYPTPLYLYGGFLRDVLLGIQPTDIDFKVVVSQTQKNKLVDQTEALVHKAGMSFLRSDQKQSMVVIRFPITAHNGKRDLSVDLAIASPKGLWSYAWPSHSIESTIKATTSFTITGFCMDTKTLQCFDVAGGRGDLQNQLIRLTNPSYNLNNTPHVVFRSVYLASKLPGFTIAKETLQYIHANATIGTKTLTLLTQTTDPLIARLLAHQVFGGLLVDPKKYFHLLQLTGLLPVVESFLFSILHRKGLLQERDIKASPVWTRSGKANIRRFFSWILRRNGLQKTERSLKQLEKACKMWTIY
ncbi:hypothetical protein HY086_02890 [Candidatus Gottesmanbacteria bacterium]|nr:hypothetical protein [Candidatus Gottesmanbacteria bacterium]